MASKLHGRGMGCTGHRYIVCKLQFHQICIGTIEEIRGSKTTALDRLRMRQPFCISRLKVPTLPLSHLARDSESQGLRNGTAKVAAKAALPASRGKGEVAHVSERLKSEDSYPPIQ